MGHAASTTGNHHDTRTTQNHRRTVSADVGIAGRRITNAPTGSATPSSASGPIGRPSACRKQGDWYARHMYIQGERGSTTTTSRNYGHPSEFGFKDIDNLWHAENWEPEKLMAALQGGRGEVLRRAGEPSRQLRLLRLEVSRVEFGPRRPAEGHRRHVGQSGPRQRPAVRRVEPLGPRLALVPNRLRLRPRRAHAPASATTANSPRPTAKANGGTASTRRNSTPAPNIVMPDGITTIKAATRLAREARPPMGRNPAAQQSALHRQVVSALPGPRRQIPSRPVVFRQHRAAARPGRPRHRRPLLQRRASPATASSKPCSRPRSSHPSTAPALVDDYERGSSDVHPAIALANRHVHRPWHYQRGMPLQIGRPGRPHAGGHRQQERQPAVEHSAPRRRHDRRSMNVAFLRGHGHVDGRRTARASSAPGRGTSTAKAQPTSPAACSAKAASNTGRKTSASRPRTVRCTCSS